MRAFHMSWLAFFVCFFAWFAVAPLMPVIKGEFGLTKDQIANINIAAVGDHHPGPADHRSACPTSMARASTTRRCSRWVRFRCSVSRSPQSYDVFLFFRLLIGAIGASFVITQYHTSVMFAPERGRHRQRGQRWLGQLPAAASRSRSCRGCSRRCSASVSRRARAGACR